jgi:hypothetical protein
MSDAIQLLPVTPLNSKMMFGAAVAALVVSAGSVSAQATANMTASATVGPSLAVAAAAGNNGQLRFGTLAQGASATVIAPSGAVAATTGPGRFDIQGLPSASVTPTFSVLPASLNGPSGATISLSTWTACTLTTTTNTGCAAASVTQGTPLTSFSLSSANPGLGYVFVGATLGAVSASQTTGTYTGTITLSVTSP